MKSERKRWIPAAGGLLLLLVAAALVLIPRGPLSAGPDLQEVRLSDGREVVGILKPLRPGRFLVQTADHCLLLSANQIAAIGGRRVDLSPLPRPGRRQVFVSEFSEEIRPDGTDLVRHRISGYNSTDEALASVSWGIAPHETIYQPGKYRVLDDWGRELPLQLDLPSDGQRGLATVTLLQPVLPGESGGLITIYEDDRPVFRDGDAFVYRNVGDFPDPRLVTRALRLPPGARVLSVTPEPIYRLDDEQDGTRIIWRRYYSPGENLPMEVRYELDG